MGVVRRMGRLSLPRPSRRVKWVRGAREDRRVLPVKTARTAPPALRAPRVPPVRRVLPAPAGSGGEGKAGESVTVKSITGGKCAEGGTEFSNASGKAFACNGEEGVGTQGPAGPTGPQGSPWTAGGTLPAGSTETGTWNAGIQPTGRKGANPGEEAEEYIPGASISFAVPLKEKLGPSSTHFVTLEEQESGQVPAGCQVERGGSKIMGLAEEPVAAEGNLCVYEGKTEGSFPPNRSYSISLDTSAGGFHETGVSGDVLFFNFEEGEPMTETVSMDGTWAVTAP